MKRLMVPMLIAFAAVFAFSANASAAGDKQLTPQQQKMADCAHKSKGLKGDEHKKFMSTCLKGDGVAAAAAASQQKAGDEAQKASAKGEETKAAATAKVGDTKAAATSQRNKMKACNTQASAQKLKGKDRRAFMSTCLKGG